MKCTRRRQIRTTTRYGGACLQKCRRVGYAGSPPASSATLWGATLHLMLVDADADHQYMHMLFRVHHAVSLNVCFRELCAKHNNPWNYFLDMSVARPSFNLDLDCVSSCDRSRSGECGGWTTPIILAAFQASGQTNERSQRFTKQSSHCITTPLETVMLPGICLGMSLRLCGLSGGTASAMTYASE